MKIKKWSFLIALVFVLTLIVPVFAANWSADVITPTANIATHEVATLYAGQDMDVGNVFIDILGDNEYLVTYQVDLAEWYLTEIHFEAISIGDLVFIQSARNSNLIPGQFSASQTFDLADEVTTYSFYYQASAPVTEFAAHAVVEMKECITNEAAPYGGGSVFASEQGTRYDNTLVKPARSVPENALLYETGANEANFFSLGFQEYVVDQPTTAYIVIEFTDPITNGEGVDLRVVEDTWGLPYPHERAVVSVSNDAVMWTEIGTADNQTPISSYHTVSDFELPEGCLSAKYVKVQDDSIRSDFDAKYPSQAATLDGFDLNAVLALHDNVTCTVYSETAWAYAGEPIRKDDGNWSTTFTIDPQWLLVDTVQVTPFGTAAYVPTPTLSNLSLVADKEYRVVASGTYRFANWGEYGVADAAWNYRDAAHGLYGVAGWCQQTTQRLQLWIEGTAVEWDPETYNPEHIYTLEMSGHTGQLSFSISDDQYADNSGFLTVDIYEKVT